MRIFSLLFLIILSLNTLAVEPIDEQQVMLYYHIPFGGSSAQQNEHQFGLRFDQTSHDPRETVHINMLDKRTAAADFRYGYKGMKSLKIHGVDYAAYLVARASEDEGDAENIDQPVAGGSAETEPEAASEESEEVVTEEKSAVQKTLDELPVGVIIGVIVGVGILSGIGG